MANRFWVGGTNLNWTSFGNWAATSGGPATASVPTIADDVFFDSNSGSSVVQVAATGSFQTISLNNLTCTGYTGTINLGGSGSANNFYIYGNLTNGAATTWTNTGSNSFSPNLYGTSKTITSNGREFGVDVIVASGATYTLTDALTVQGDFYVQGTFTTANYNVNILGKVSPLTFGYCFLYGTLNLGSSTFTVNNFRVEDPAAVVNAGTSTVAFPQSTIGVAGISGGGKTFYNVTVVVLNTGTGTASTGFSIESGFTCNNLTFAGSAPSYSGNRLTMSGDVTVNGTLTFTGASVKNRIFVTSSSVETARTFTANACTASYVDFSSITIAGAAAPISGTSISDVKRNSGINFTAPKTVYFVYTGAPSFTSWNDVNVWATTSGGVGSDANYPLAQDTVIYDDNSSIVGVTFSMNAASTYAYLFVGNLSFVNRTNSLTIFNTSNLCAVSNVTFSPAVTATQVTITFLNSSPITYTPSSTVGFGMFVNCFGSTVNLVGSLTIASSISFSSGTFNIGSNTLTFTGSAAIISNSSSASQLNTGTGIVNFTGIGNFSGSLFDVANQNFSVGGSGTIRSSNGTTSTKIISLQPNTLFTATIDQAGPGPLRIQSGGTYQGITNSYGPTAATTVQLVGGQTYTFPSFNLSGTAGKLCTLTTVGTRANLRRPTGIWYMGANSVDAGSNSGLVFTAGGGVDYLSVSKINGINNENGFLVFF